jgi:hypothetical protein
MGFQLGEWVETKAGERGKVIHTSRLTVFVAFPREGQPDIVAAFLESQLAKIEPPPSAAHRSTFAHLMHRASKRRQPHVAAVARRLSLQWY